MLLYTSRDSKKNLERPSIIRCSAGTASPPTHFIQIDRPMFPY
jgi:hypothetical protein